MRLVAPQGALLVGALTVVGCLAPAPRTAGGADDARLVVFTAESDATKNPGLDGVAGALNRALADRVGGQSGSRVSPVNIADARAVVEECNSSGAAERCLAALASLNHAAQVVVPELSRDDHGVTVALTLYDAATQKVLRTSQKSYKSAREAEGGMKELVAELAPGSGG
jgi:hypothetical protein